MKISAQMGSILSLITFMSPIGLPMLRIVILGIDAYPKPITL